VIPVDSDSSRRKHALFATNWNLSGIAVDTFVNPSRHLRTYPSSVSPLAMMRESKILPGYMAFRDTSFGTR
jgi:hypothetical protein